MSDSKGAAIQTTSGESIVGAETICESYWRARTRETQIEVDNLKLLLRKAFNDKERPGCYGPSCIELVKTCCPSCWYAKAAILLKCGT